METSSPMWFSKKVLHAWEGGFPPRATYLDTEVSEIFDSEFEQLTVNSGCAPQRVGLTHRADESSHLRCNCQATSLLAAALSRPVSLETLST